MDNNSPYFQIDSFKSIKTYSKAHDVFLLVFSNRLKLI